MATITKRSYKHKDGSTKEFWQASIRRKGYPNVSKAFDTWKEADLFVRKTEGRIVNNEKIDNKSKDAPITAIIDEYLSKFGDKDSDRNVRRIKVLRQEFEHFSPATLTPAIFEGWILQRQKINADATVYWYYTSLKKILLWHSKIYQYRQDLFNDVKCTSGKTERVRDMTDAEFDRIFKAIDDHMITKQDELKWSIIFAKETAMRAGEMLTFKWSNVSPDFDYVNLPAEITKTKTARKVILTTIAEQVLREVYKRYPPPQNSNQDSDERVFSFYGDTRHLSRQYKLITQKAGIKDLCWHILRHVATSQFFEKSTLNDVEIAKITGHKNMNMLKRYTHLRKTATTRSKLW